MEVVPEMFDDELFVPWQLSIDGKPQKGGFGNYRRDVDVRIIDCDRCTGQSPHRMPEQYQGF